jgi:hypothetical protein
VIGFLGIKHYHLERNPETGNRLGRAGRGRTDRDRDECRRFTTEDKSRGLLMSGDKNFRPSDAIFAPDGSLYISDWHNVIIGHMQHNVRDPNRDHVHGRIYRMTAKGRPLAAAGRHRRPAIPALLDNLKSPVDGDSPPHARRTERARFQGSHRRQSRPSRLVMASSSMPLTMTA